MAPVTSPRQQTNNIQLHQTRERTISKQKISKTPISDVFVKACKDGDMEKVNACLTLGVDINCTDKDGHSGLYYITQPFSKEALFDYFVQHPDLDIEQVNREKILEDLCICLGTERLRKVCNLPGIDVNAGNPLRKSSFHNNKEHIKILAEHPELDWNNGDECHGYPITEALDRGHADIVELLLEQPTLDLNVTRSKGRSVGHCAVERKGLRWGLSEGLPVKCVELLSKDPRVNWNIRNVDGDTPIMVALKNKEIEMVKILVRTPGVHLGDIIKVKEGNDLLKEILQKAAEESRSLTSKVPECPVGLN